MKTAVNYGLIDYLLSLHFALIWLCDKADIGVAPNAFHSTAVRPIMLSDIGVMRCNDIGMPVLLASSFLGVSRDTRVLRLSALW